MKRILLLLVISSCILSCNNNAVIKGKFSLSGEIKNVPDQKIYLEQLYFSQKNPEIIDTAEIKNGKFTLSASANEEGLYRIRTEKMGAGFIFINDNTTINFKADINDVSLDGPKFDTRANSILKNLILNLDKKSRELSTANERLDSLVRVNDSTVAVEKIKCDGLNDQYKTFILRFIDTCSDPVVTMFALGFTKNMDVSLLETLVPSLGKRFPNHQGVATMVAQFNQYIAKLKEPKPESKPRPEVGGIAPDFTMNDTAGKPFSLSELKGKYVLVDFWASWCGPCRGENPNVVTAYEKYNAKNFTILGVSLDEDRDAWIKAIKNDNLNWKQVSDLKHWNSAAVPLYGFEGIPYNVLIDPSGKIIATELRGEALQEKLAEVLK